MTHVTCRLTAKNQDQLRNPTLGNRLWATSTLFTEGWALNVTTATLDRCSHGETLPVPRPSPWKSDRGRTFPPRTSSRSLTGTACRQCGRTAADVRASPTGPPADNLLRDDIRRTVRRIWSGGQCPLPPEAKKIVKIWLRNGAFWSISE